MKLAITISALASTVLGLFLGTLWTRNVLSISDQFGFVVGSGEQRTAYRMESTGGRVTFYRSTATPDEAPLPSSLSWRSQTWDQEIASCELAMCELFAQPTAAGLATSHWILLVLLSAPVVGLLAVRANRDGTRPLPEQPLTQPLATQAIERIRIGLKSESVRLAQDGPTGFEEARLLSRLQWQNWSRGRGSSNFANWARPTA